MNDTYDIWVDYTYEGWRFYGHVGPSELADQIEYCEKNGHDYIVYNSKDRQLESN